MGKFVVAYRWAAVYQLYVLVSSAHTTTHRDMNCTVLIINKSIGKWVNKCTVNTEVIFLGNFNGGIILVPKCFEVFLCVLDPTNGRSD